jgi:hypothetical protein
LRWFFYFETSIREAGSGFFRLEINKEKKMKKFTSAALLAVAMHFPAVSADDAHPIWEVSGPCVVVKTPSGWWCRPLSKSCGFGGSCIVEKRNESLR